MNRIWMAVALGILLLCAVCVPIFFLRGSTEPVNTPEAEAPLPPAAKQEEPADIQQEQQSEQSKEEAVPETTEQAVSAEPSTPAKPPEEEKKLADYLYNPLVEPISFRGETVTEVYSLDGDGYRYHPVAYAGVIRQVTALLENGELPNDPAANMVGFLIFTEKGKYACYLNAERMDTDMVYDELVELSEQCNADAAGGVQWLIYMTPSNLSRLTYSGLGGDGYSLSAQEETYTVQADITDRKALDDISAFLKKLNVRPAERLPKEQAVAPRDTYNLWTLRMEFSTGVVYDIFGYRSELYISSSDMDSQLHYWCSDMEILRLRDYMLRLEGAVIAPDNAET